MVELAGSALHAALAYFFVPPEPLKSSLTLAVTGSKAGQADTIFI